MKIEALHLINGRFFGGGHKSTLILMAALDACSEVRTELCTLGSGGALPLGEKVPSTVPFDGRYNNPIVLLRSARALRKLVQAKRPKILHTHGLDADLVGAIAVLGLGIQHVCHLRITPALDAQESWRVGARKALFRSITGIKGTRFIAVSEAVRDQMAAYYRIDKGRITTVRNGVDLSQFSFTERGASGVNASGRTLQLGTAGRLAPMKGFEYLLDAISLLKERSVDVELRVAGSGSELENLTGRAAALGISDRVTFVGQVCRMEDFYRSLDVFILPSVSTEGLPLVVLEAMAVGVPVVATDLAGAPEVISHGANGLLVPTRDAAALADAIAILAADPVLRENFSKAGNETVRKEFEVSRVAAEVTEIYRDLVGSSQ